MKKITQEELDIVLAKHKQWLIDTKNATCNSLGSSLTSCQAYLCDTDLRGFDFQYADLRFANLSHTDCSGVNFYRAKLTGACLTRSQCKGCNFEQANLHKSMLDCSMFDGSSFYKTNMSMATASESSFRGANLRNAICKCLTLTNAHLVGADASYADFSGCGIQMTIIDGCNFYGANIDDRDLYSYLSCGHSRYARD